MAKLITVYWREIPSQVMVRVGRDTSKVMLSPRFQEAIALVKSGNAANQIQ